jgi:hypothetical protein
MESRTNGAGGSVFVAVNAIAPGRRSRTRDSIGAIRHVFLEADHDGPAVLAKVADRSDLPEPSYILHSSPNRVHIFWHVNGFEPEQVEALQKRLARELGTDIAATPASQTTRMVGFKNHKYSPAISPFACSRLTPGFKRPTTSIAIETLRLRNPGAFHESIGTNTSLG